MHFESDTLNNGSYPKLFTDMIQRVYSSGPIIVFHEHFLPWLLHLGTHYSHNLHILYIVNSWTKRTLRSKSSPILPKRIFQPLHLCVANNPRCQLCFQMIHIYTHTRFIIVALDDRFPLLCCPFEEFQLGVCVANDCLEEVVEAMIYFFSITVVNIIAHVDKGFTLGDT